jgi:hypothetical protein
MSLTPPNISPRLRSRQPIVPAEPVHQPVRLETPGLRVLIRLPNVASDSTASPRLMFASRLFSTLKRKYAAAAFAVFVVCMVAMLLRGKRGVAPHDEAGADAPRWNSAVTVGPSKPGPSAPITQSAASQPHSDDGPMPWSAQQSSVDPSRRLAPEVGSLNKAAASASTATAANSTGSPRWDNPPTMPTRYPLREAMADRAPTHTLPPAWPATDYRAGQAPDPSAAGPGRPAAGFDQSNQARFSGRIDAPQQQPNYDPAARPFR